MLIKAGLVSQINRLREQREWSYQRFAQYVDKAVDEVERIFRGQFREYSADTFQGWLDRMNSEEWIGRYQVVDDLPVISKEDDDQNDAELADLLARSRRKE